MSAYTETIDGLKYRISIIEDRISARRRRLEKDESLLEKLQLKLMRKVYAKVTRGDS